MVQDFFPFSKKHATRNSTRNPLLKVSFLYIEGFNENQIPTKARLIQMNLEIL